MAAVPQTDEEEMETSQIWGSTNGNEAKVSPRASFIVPAVGLMVVGVLALGAIRANVAPQTAQDQAGIVQLGDFKIPTLPANPIDELKKEIKQPITKFKADLGINDLRGDQIALCVVNLNLGIWKVIQVGALITKTVDNCAYQTTNIDKKVACNINLAAIIVTLSEMMAFFTSTSALCTGKTNPDARCAVFMALTFRHLALFAAAENQIALFCPKASYETTVVEGGVRTYDAAERRLLSNSSFANSSADRELSAVVVPDPPPLRLQNCFAHGMLLRVSGSLLVFPHWPTSHADVARQGGPQGARLLVPR